jgi:hypothetical protein
LPGFLAEELAAHISEFAGDGAEGLVFRSEKGAMLRRGNFGRAVKWPETVKAVGLPGGFHFHDLRHTGNQLTADAGATTRELMHRMGHGSMRAALLCQHATTDRDRRIADAMQDMIDASRTASDADSTTENGEDDGPSGALVPVAYSTWTARTTSATSSMIGSEPHSRR